MNTRVQMRLGLQLIVVVASWASPMLAAAHSGFDFILAEYANTVVWRSHHVPCSEWRLTGLGAAHEITARDSVGCADSFASGNNERFCVATIVGADVRVTLSTPHEHTKTRAGRTLPRAPAQGVDLCSASSEPVRSDPPGGEPAETPDLVNEQIDPPPSTQSRQFVPSSWRNALSALRRR